MQILSNTGIVNNPDIEEPILGAPVLFELIRSYNNQNPAPNPNEAKLAGNIITGKKNQYEPDSSTLQNPTNYNGFFERTNPATPINFARNSIVNSNPYILLTHDDIVKNAQGLEQDFTTMRNTAKIKNAVDDYWNRITGYDKLVQQEMKEGINVDKQRRYNATILAFT